MPPATARTDLAPTVMANSADHPSVTEAAPGWLTRLWRRLFAAATPSIRDDLEVALEHADEPESDITPLEGAMLKNILGLRERRIEDVMIPRADIIAVPNDISLGALIEVFENAGHSRLVVYGETLDDPLGMIHIRDLIAHMVRHARKDGAAENTAGDRPSLDLGAVDLSINLAAANLMRPLLFVPPSMQAVDLLVKMQATRVHLALVIDEYGGTDGLVSMEDIVEEVVGEIEDEHDVDEVPGIVPQPDGSFIADGRSSLEDVSHEIGPDFDVGEAVEEVSTLAGYVATRIGRVPVRGQLVPGPESFEIEILDADPRRIKKVRIYRLKTSSSRGPQSRGGDSKGDGAPRSATAP
jgi:CBS domain containing-hemolysin-like protein